MKKSKKIMICNFALLIFIILLFSLGASTYAATNKTYVISSNRGPRLKYDASNSKMVTISVIDNDGISSVLVEQYLNGRYTNITSKLRISNDKATVTIPSDIIKERISIRIKAEDKKGKNYSVNFAIITKNKSVIDGQYFSINASPRIKIVSMPCANKNSINAFIIQAVDGNKILQCKLTDLNNSNQQQVVNLKSANTKEFVTFGLNKLKMKNSCYYILLQTKDGKGNESVERIKFSIKESNEKIPKYIAHRGASLEFPENTVEAFKKASLNSNMFGVETDIRDTADKELICMHDNTIARVTNESNNTTAINKLNYKNYLKNVNIKSNDGKVYKIATYGAYLNVLKSSGRNAIIELKTKDKQAINKIVQMVKTNNMEKKAIIISFDYDSLQYIRSTLNKNIKLCFLAREATEENILKAQRLNNSIIGLNGNNITEEFINSAHQKNVEVNTWTVDSYAERAKLYYMGVDYITTNNMNA